MTAVFTTVDGMMLHESRGGVESFYVPDPLGSLIQTKNTSGTVTYDATYWPYGEVRTETGTNPSSWGFVGLLGYLRDLADLLYVRARYYRPKSAQWMTVDPLWPGEMAYGYVKGEAGSSWVPWEIGVATEKDYPLGTHLIDNTPPLEFMLKWPVLKSRDHLMAFANALGRII